jgi:Rps23 Pro-64 3,4-dihydroxylase Tpa1-like proline 4-hydroxylase
VKSKTPFPHAVIENFLPGSAHAALCKRFATLAKERKEADLFSFSQTADLMHDKSREIAALRAHLQSDATRARVRELLGVRVGAKIDMSGFSYTDGDYLLCHDDQLEGRKVAYVYYLSTLSTNQGGALALLDSDRKGAPRRVVKRLQPSANALAIFAVSKRSHHMVEEVMNAQRDTITGWFHG